MPSLQSLKENSTNLDRLRVTWNKWLVKKGLENAGSADREQLRDALSKLEVLPGPDLIIPYEKIKFDETGMNTYGRPLIAQKVVEIARATGIGAQYSDTTLEHWSAACGGNPHRI